MNILRISILGLALSAGTAYSQNCEAMPPQSDFEITELGTAPGMAMDIAVAKSGKVFWVERYGAFKSWDPATRQVATVKTFDVLYKSTGDAQYYKAVETGLEGLALDPDFATNHWVYLWRSLPASQAGGLSPHALSQVQRLARFTLKNNDGEVDMASEKTIFETRFFAQCCHFGGDLEWGPDGNLWISTGDNIHYEYSNVNPYQDANAYSDVRATAANSNDYRGKILRIKLIRFPDTQTPAAGVGTTYEIPAGNLKETWPTEKDKIKAEIYSMGHRNPFSISVHPDAAKLWVGVGEAGGATEGSGEDEINLVTKPGFFGWPYFTGGNTPYNQAKYPGPGNPFANPSAVLNESSKNTGIKTLPPATPAIISPKTAATKMGMTCLGVTWGWVKYDATLNNKAKWPAYLANKLLVSSHGNAPVMAATIDESGKVSRMEQLFSGGTFTTDIMRAAQGPDGAFYVARGDALNFNTSSASRVYRVAYKGPCFVVGTNPGSARMASLLARRDRVINLGNTQVSMPAGVRKVEAYALDGALAWTAERSDARFEESRTIPASVTRGMLQLRYSAE